MYKYFGFVLFFLSCKVSLPSQVQPIESGEILINNGNIISFKVDKLNNIYTIDKKAELIKYDHKGTRLYTYTDKTLGPIDHLDVSNPLKLLAFYRDYQSLIFLDNTLSVTSRFNEYSR